MIATPDNFGQDSQCKLCHINGDTMTHVLECILLKREVPEILTLKDNCIRDVFNNDMKIVNEVAVVFEKAWRKREEFLLVNI